MEEYEASQERQKNSKVMEKSEEFSDTMKKITAEEEADEQEDHDETEENNDFLEPQQDNIQTSESSEVIKTMTKQEKVARDNKDDAYLIDYSTLMNLPRSVIQEAIEYAKKKREEEDTKSGDQYIRLKCIPPWAKSYKTERLMGCVSKGTQYELDGDEIKKIMEDERKSKGELKKMEDQKVVEGKEGEGKEGEGEIDEEEDKRKDDKPEGITEEEKKRELEMDYEGKEDRKRRGTLPDKEGMSSIGLQIQPTTCLSESQTGSSSLLDVHLSAEGEKKVKSGDEKQRKKISELLASGIPIEELTEEDRKQLGIEGEEKEEEEGKKQVEDNELFKLDLTKKDLSKLISEEKLKLAAGEIDEKMLIQLLHEKERLAHDETVKAKDEEKIDGEGEKEDEDGKVEDGLGEKKLTGEQEAEGVEEEEEDEELSAVSSEEDTNQTADYLKNQLGRILAISLAEIAWKRPADPVHYLAHKLYNARKQEKMQAQKSTEKNVLEVEKENLMLTDDMKIKTFGLIARPEELSTLPKADSLMENEEDEQEEEYEQEKIDLNKPDFENFIDEDIKTTVEDN